MEELTTAAPDSALWLLFWKNDLMPSLLFLKSILMPLSARMPPERYDFLSSLPSFVELSGNPWLFVSMFVLFLSRVPLTMALSELSAPISSS